MHRSTLMLFAAALVWDRLVAALPLQNLQLPDPLAQATAAVDCNNLTAAFSQTCWDTLNVADYLGNPQTGWIQTVPTCDPSTPSGINKQGCCDFANNEPWSTCYLRLGRGLPGADCSTINVGGCEWDEEQLNSTLSPSEQARARYVIWNIVSINRFFDTYFTALQYAASMASDMIDSLTALIDPKQKPKLTMTIILSVLGVALCFLGLPAVLDGVAATVAGATASVASKELQSGLKNTAQLFTLASISAPGFAKAMWPQGTDDSQGYQDDQLETMLSQARDQIGDTLNSGIGVLMTDASQFILFAGDGRYSGQVPLSVPAQTDALSLSLKTLLTGESLLQNNWFANSSPSPTWDGEYNLSTWSDCSNQGTNIYSCKNQPYYYSDSTGRYYAFRNKKGGTDNALNILQQISSNGWADMNVLFDGAYNCTASGLAGGPPINSNANGTLDMTCISQLPIFTDNKDLGCPAPLLSSGCPFGQQEW